jgi:Uri superfamily endonuclease
LKGIYVLLIRVNEDIEVRVGSLGRVRFVRGVYVYMGSAQTNLEARVRRHFRKKKHKFWHVDYLLDSPESKVTKVFFRAGAKSQECAAAKEMETRGEAIKGFGCSDCDCAGHLFRLFASEYFHDSMQEPDIDMFTR